LKLILRSCVDKLSNSFYFIEERKIDETTVIYWSVECMVL